MKNYTDAQHNRTLIFSNDHRHIVSDLKFDFKCPIV